jgi:hypothetical protein
LVGRKEFRENVFNYQSLGEHVNVDVEADKVMRMMSAKTGSSLSLLSARGDAIIHDC